MEHMYNFRLNYFKYKRIDDKTELGEQEKVKEAAKLNLKMMIHIAKEEVESKKPTSREFRHWLIWNEEWIQIFGETLGLAICTDFRRDLPKCPRISVFSLSSTIVNNSQDFQTLLYQLEHDINSLQRRSNKNLLRKNITRQFCSLLSKLSKDLYEQNKSKLDNYYESLFSILSSHQENQLKEQLTETYKLCRRTFEINLTDDIDDDDDEDDINDEKLRTVQQTVIETKLKKMYHKKIIDFWNDIDNKSGPVYEKCEIRLRTLKNQYLNLSMLFNEDSLNLNGIKYIKNKWGNRVISKLSNSFRQSLYKDPIPIGSFLLKMIVLTFLTPHILQLVIFRTSSFFSGLFGVIMLTPVLFTNTMGNLIREYESYELDLATEMFETDFSAIKIFQKILKKVFGISTDSLNKEEQDKDQGNNRSNFYKNLVIKMGNVIDKTKDNFKTFIKDSKEKIFSVSNSIKSGFCFLRDAIRRPKQFLLFYVIIPMLQKLFEPKLFIMLLLILCFLLYLFHFFIMDIFVFISMLIYFMIFLYIVHIFLLLFCDYNVLSTFIYYIGYLRERLLLLFLLMQYNFNI